MFSDPLELTTKPYRIAVQPQALETVESYSRRLTQTNFDYEKHRRYLIRVAARFNPEESKDDLWRSIVEHKGGLQEGHFAHTRAPRLVHPDGSACPHCTVGLDRRFMCIRCAGGETVAQYPHLNGNVCLTHRCWIAPDTAPLDQLALGPEHVKAETQYRRLRKRRMISAPFYMELRHMFRQWQTLSNDDDQGTIQADVAVYPVMMEVATGLAERDLMRQYFDPSKTFAEAYATLHHMVQDVVERDTEWLTRQLWLYLRPVFLNIRESLQNETPYTAGWAHDFPTPNSIVTEFARPIRPLEPFDRYLAASSDEEISADNWREVLLHHPLRPMLRSDVSPSSNDCIPSICPRGHRFTLRPTDTHPSRSTSNKWCPYCANRTVLAGYNDLGTTHPLLARQLHPTNNGNIDPSTVSASWSRKLWWVCPAAGHAYAASVTNRARYGTDCPICANVSIQPGVNDLATLRPDLAKQWDRERNTMNPNTVGKNSHTAVQWRCPLGHPYWMTPTQRSRGQGCPICANRRVLPGFNDVKTRYPGLATEWDTDSDPFKVLPGSAKYRWVCAYGHVSEQTISNRLRTGGCPECPKSERILIAKERA